MPGGGGQPFGVTIQEVPKSWTLGNIWVKLSSLYIYIKIINMSNIPETLFGICLGFTSDGLKLGLLQCTEVLKSELSRNAQSKKCPVHFSGCGSQEMNIHEHPSSWVFSFARGFQHFLKDMEWRRDPKVTPHTATQG
jgi:hypothetical protein